MNADEPVSVDRRDIEEGLRALGLDDSSAVIVHASLASFGRVDGGAEAVGRALTAVCGTVLMASGTWDATGVPAPPGLVRPHNAAHCAATWAEFDQALAAAVPFDADLPVDRELGRVAEALRRLPHRRGSHPLFGFLAAGRHADQLIDAARDDWPLGPVEALADLGGDVLLLGVSHEANTAIHLAEQRLGRGRFFRYAKAGDGTWMELPNVSGDSHRFDDIEPHLRPVTASTRIGACLARRVAVADVLSCATGLITADAAALLCTDDAQCRCAAARRQRLAAIDAVA